MAKTAKKLDVVKAIDDVWTIAEKLQELHVDARDLQLYTAEVHDRVFDLTAGSDADAQDEFTMALVEDMRRRAIQLDAQIEELRDQCYARSNLEAGKRAS